VVDNAIVRYQKGEKPLEVIEDVGKDLLREGGSYLGKRAANVIGVDPSSYLPSSMQPTDLRIKEPSKKKKRRLNFEKQW
jgi:hypothetical protein